MEDYAHRNSRGSNIGLISSLAVFAKINNLDLLKLHIEKLRMEKLNLMKVPYIKVLSEIDQVIAQANAELK